MGATDVVLFGLLTGIAALSQDRCHGWARLAPVLVALWAILTELVPVILIGQPLPKVYSAFWGVFGALLGWAR